MPSKVASCKPYTYKHTLTTPLAAILFKVAASKVKVSKVVKKYQEITRNNALKRLLTNASPAKKYQQKNICCSSGIICTASAKVSTTTATIKFSTWFCNGAQYQQISTANDWGDVSKNVRVTFFVDFLLIFVYRHLWLQVTIVLVSSWLLGMSRPMIPVTTSACYQTSALCRAWVTVWLRTVQPPTQSDKWLMMWASPSMTHIHPSIYLIYHMVLLP